MKRYIIPTIILFFGSTLWAQSDAVFTVVEDMPRFSGCEAYYDSLAQELNRESNLKAEREKCAMKKLVEFLSQIEYPEEAKKEKKEGKAFLRFVIDTDGRVINTEIARSTGHTILDNAALDYLNSSPKWIPGKQRGNPVKVQFVVPVNFSL